MAAIEKCPFAPYLQEQLTEYVNSPNYRNEEYPGGITVQRANGPPFVDRDMTGDAIAELITDFAETDCSGPCKEGDDKCYLMNEAAQLFIRSSIGKVPRYELENTDN